jgi:ABC-2 type transport system permease protein
VNAVTQVWLLSKREFLERSRTRAFIITMAVIAVAILAAGPVISALTGGEPDATVVGLVGTELPGIEDELAAQGELFAIEIEVVRYETRDGAGAALESGDAHAVLVDSTEIVFHENDSTTLTALIARAVNVTAAGSTLRDLGLSDEQIAAMREPAPLAVVIIDEADANDEAQRGAAFVGAILLYLSIIMFGQFVAMGTVEEKQNRVVEVVLSRVRAWQVLVGKVLGIGVLGLLQLAILLGAAFISAQLAGFTDVDVAGIGLPIVGRLFFWFVLGYTFYAFLYAAVGSTVSRQEDLQGSIMLPLAVILPGYLLAIAALDDPDTMLARVGSLLPMWSPFVMPVRIAAGSAALWEIAVAIGGSVAGAIGLVWVGSRIYRGALLHVGTKLKIKDAWKIASGDN